MDQDSTVPETSAEIFLAIKNGNAVADLLERELEVNHLRDTLLSVQDTVDRLTPLHTAIKTESTATVERILGIASENGLSRDLLLAKDTDGVTPLHFAAKRNQTYVVGVIFDIARNNKGLLQEVMMNQDSWGFTPLHSAAVVYHHEAVAQIIDVSRDEGFQREILLAKDNHGALALRYSAEVGDSVSVGKFLEAARESGLLCEVSQARDEDGYSALHWAGMKGRAPVVERILEIIVHDNKLLRTVLNLPAMDKTGSTPLHLAALNGNAATVKQFLKSVENNSSLFREILFSKNSNGYTPFHLAAKEGHASVAKEILKMAKQHGLAGEILDVTDASDNANDDSSDDASDDASDDEGFTATQIAANNGHTSTVAKILSLALDPIFMGAEAFHEFCKSLLKWAATNSYLPTMNQVLDIALTNGCLKDILLLVDRGGNTLLHRAICKPESHDLLEKILETAQENDLLHDVLTAKDYRDSHADMVPLHYALVCGGDGGTAIKILETAMSDICLCDVLLATDRYGNTPLHFALRRRENGAAAYKILEKAKSLDEREGSLGRVYMNHAYSNLLAWVLIAEDSHEVTPLDMILDTHSGYPVSMSQLLELAGFGTLGMILELNKQE